MYLGNPVISTVTLASCGTCVELSATRSKVPHHTYTWWGPPLKSVGGTSRILTLPSIRWWGCLWCSYYRYCYWSNSVLLLFDIHVICTVMLVFDTRCVELSVTRHKVLHHIYGGGHLLNLWGATSRISHRRLLVSWRCPQSTSYSDQIHVTFNNPTIMTSEMLAIWALSRSNNGTRSYVRMSSAGVRVSVWTISSTGRYWLKY